MNLKSYYQSGSYCSSIFKVFIDFSIFPPKKKKSLTLNLKFMQNSSGRQNFRGFNYDQTQDSNDTAIEMHVGDDIIFC